MKATGEWSEALLKLIKRVNNFNYRDACTTGGCVPFYIGKHKVGVILPDTLTQLLKYPHVFRQETSKANNEDKSVHLHESLQTVQEREDALAEVIADLRAKEKFSIYFRRDEPTLASIERSACPLLGVLQYGCHVNGYTYQDGVLMMWVGKRSMTKPTYPGMLDNMCAGGLATGLAIMECAIKECGEEGSVGEQDLKNLKSVGTLSYCFQDKRGILPETQYVFDLELSPDFVPCNADGEVEGFQLCSVEQLQDLIIEEKFKPNCAVVIVDFMIRHGFLTPDSEPRFSYLVEMMHVNLQPAL